MAALGAQTRERSTSRLAAWAAIAAAVSGGSGCNSQARDLSATQLTEVVAREQPSLEPCYQAGLDRTPYEHEFRVEAKLAIRPDGSVEKVELDQNGLQGMGPCLQKAILTWRFPQANAATYASLPIIFRPKVVNDPAANIQLPPGFQVLPPADKP